MTDCEHYDFDRVNRMIHSLSRSDLRSAKAAQEGFGGVGSFDVDGNFEPNCSAKPSLTTLSNPAREGDLAMAPPRN